MQAHPTPTLPPKFDGTELPANGFGSIYEWRWFCVIVVAAIAAVAVLSSVLLVLADAEARVAHASPVQVAQARCTPGVAFRGGMLTQCGDIASSATVAATVAREPVTPR